MQSVITHRQASGEAIEVPYRHTPQEKLSDTLSNLKGKR
jgi:hypothetical protein